MLHALCKKVKALLVMLCHYVITARVMSFFKIRIIMGTLISAILTVINVCFFQFVIKNNVFVYI